MHVHSIVRAEMTLTGQSRSPISISFVVHGIIS